MPFVMGTFLIAVDCKAERCARPVLRIVRAMIPAEILLEGYRRGVFPMAMSNGEIGWFSPNPRGIIPLDAFHVPHGLERTLRRGKFAIRTDTCFEEVMRGCAEREDTWIDEQIIVSYCELHRLGFAHSVETWDGETLAGGLY